MGLINALGRSGCHGCLGGAKNAGILAVEILSVADPELSRAVAEYKKKLSSEVKKKAAQLEKLGASIYLERMS